MGKHNPRQQVPQNSDQSSDSSIDLEQLKEHAKKQRQQRDRLRKQAFFAANIRIYRKFMQQFKISAQYFQRVFCFYARQHALKWKHQHPRMRESQIIQKVHKTWAQMAPQDRCQFIDGLVQKGLLLPQGYFQLRQSQINQSEDDQVICQPPKNLVNIIVPYQQPQATQKGIIMECMAPQTMLRSRHFRRKQQASQRQRKVLQLKSQQRRFEAHSKKFFQKQYMMFKMIQMAKQGLIGKSRAAELLKHNLRRRAKRAAKRSSGQTKIQNNQMQQYLDSLPYDPDWNKQQKLWPIQLKRRNDIIKKYGGFSKLKKQFGKKCAFCDHPPNTSNGLNKHYQHQHSGAMLDRIFEQIRHSRSICRYCGRAVGNALKKHYLTCERKIQWDQIQKDKVQYANNQMKKQQKRRQEELLQQEVEKRLKQERLTKAANYYCEVTLINKQIEQDQKIRQQSVSYLDNMIRASDYLKSEELFEAQVRMDKWINSMSQVERQKYYANFTRPGQQAYISAQDRARKEQCEKIENQMPIFQEQDQ